MIRSPESFLVVVLCSTSEVHFKKVESKERVLENLFIKNQNSATLETITSRPVTSLII